MSSSEKLPVSERALLQRINRVLEKDGAKIRVVRNETYKRAHGRYALIRTDRLSASFTDINLVEYATKLGCIEPYEELAS